MYIFILLSLSVASYLDIITTSINIYYIKNIFIEFNIYYDGDDILGKGGTKNL